MLELKHVSKQYGRGAVGADDVSLIVEAGALMDGEVKVGREDPPAPSA